LWERFVGKQNLFGRRQVQICLEDGLPFVGCTHLYGTHRGIDRKQNPLFKAFQLKSVLRFCPFQGASAPFRKNTLSQMEPI
jgi:hypothetical protein